MVRIKRRIEPRKRSAIKPEIVAELGLGPKVAGGDADYDSGEPANDSQDCLTFS